MRNKRFRQADREALITLGVYGFFFIWWTLFSFGMGSGDPEHYSYVMGMPAWFFYSCVLGYPVVTVLLWAVIKCCFVEMPLEASDVSAAENADAVTPASDNEHQPAARIREDN